MQQTHIHFFGGAGTVTGSHFMLESGETKILVDCGLFQGAQDTEHDNWAPFPYDPKSVPVLINTHAHIDHVGRIPKLVKDGFRGRIISTEATRAIVEPLLMDSMELLRHIAEKAGKEPLYDEHDIKQTMELWEGVPYHTTTELMNGFSFQFLNSGHILGSAMAEIARGEKKIVFTGDLGGGNSPLLSLPEPLPKVDYLVMESVYGDRVRPNDANHVSELEDVIEDVASKEGTLLIPAFSMERTQDLLFEIRTLMTEKRIPSMPVYIDSPLASAITRSFLAHPEYFADGIRARIEKGEKIFDFPELEFVDNVRESQGIGHKKGAKIIIAGSGMSNGGRVLAHELSVLPDPHSTVLIVGYQAAGSMGRHLAEGMKEITLAHQKVKVACSVRTIYGYSAHMDGEELLEFVNKGQESLEKVFVVMGEPKSSGTLVQRIRDYLGVDATNPEAGETATIEL